MARYTESILAAARQRYENTDQPLRSIAAELQIGERNLQRLVTLHGWAKRSERLRGLPVAMQLLEEAKRLATHSAHSRESGNPVRTEDAAKELDPRLRGDDRGERGDDRSEQPSPIDRLEALVVDQITAEEARRAQMTGKERVASASERNARTLASLTQTFHVLQRMRAGLTPEQETLPHDDMPADLDEFRRDLARRIDAFVASRTDAADADGNAAPAALDEAG